MNTIELKVANPKKSSLKHALLIGLALSTVLMGASDGRTAFAQDIIVDDFTEPESLEVSPVLDTTATNYQENLPTSSVVGGTREATLEILPDIDPLSEFDITMIAIDTDVTGLGLFDQSVLGAAFGNYTRTTLSWYGGRENPGDPLSNRLGLGLAISNYDRFQVRVERFNLIRPELFPATSIGTIALRVTNDLDAIPVYSTALLTLDTIPATLDPRVFNVYFWQFSDPSVFFRPIQQVQLEILGTYPGLLFTLEKLTVTVPEPSPILGCLIVFGTQIILSRGGKRR